MASDSEVHNMEPEYAYPDDNLTVTTRSNEAYGMTGVPPVEPDRKLEPATSKQENISDQVKYGSKSLILQIIMLLLGLLVILAVALAASALHRSEVCDCVSNLSPVVDNTQIEEMIADALSSVEARLNQTNLELEQSQEQVRMLSAQVAQLSENVTQALDPAPVPTQPPLSLLHTCNSTVEQECTVSPLLGNCITNEVVMVDNDTVVTSLQCVRAEESDEFNPLIATLDITGNLGKCICSVLSGFEGVTRASPVTCGLQVTRCAL